MYKPITASIVTPKAFHWFYLSVGWVSTSLGFVGAFVPVMPTTPFLLIALWAFSKSSPRLQQWLFDHPQFGKSLRDWHEFGAIRPAIKIFSISAMAMSVAIVYSITDNLLLVSAHIAIVSLTSLFILSRPAYGTRAS